MVEWHRAAYTMHLFLPMMVLLDYDVVFQRNLRIVANAMTDVEGVVDEVVMGEGDALGVARSTRGELKTHTQRVTSTELQLHTQRQLREIFKPECCRRRPSWSCRSARPPSWSRRSRRCSSPPWTWPLPSTHCSQSRPIFFLQCSLSKFLATLVALLHFTPVSHLVGRQVVVSK